LTRCSRTISSTSPQSAYGIAHGVFGQLAAGGDVRTFHRVDGVVDRRLRRRGERLVRAYGAELGRSEALADRALRTWYRGPRPAADEQLERTCPDLDDLPILEHARAAPGCLDFSLSPDLLDPGRVNVYERWESHAALLAYRESDGPELDDSIALTGAAVELHHISASEAP
jgi:hypothetical protein